MESDMFDALVCPECKGKLGYDKKGLRCNKCKHTFPIEKGIHNLIPQKI